ncbi:MAG: hypothetical protein J6D02_13515 [Lachnospira sp.]|nr:hypothetical protein [Lachnospira sp.]
MSIEKRDDSCFWLFENFVTRLKIDLKKEFNEKLLDKLIDKSLIVTIKREDEVYVYKDDLDICKEIMHLNFNLTEMDYRNVGYNESFFVERIKIEKETFFCYNIQGLQKTAPVFVRNIIYMFKDKYKKCD